MQRSLLLLLFTASACAQRNAERDIVTRIVFGDELLNVESSRDFVPATLSGTPQDFTLVRTDDNTYQIRTIHNKCLGVLDTDDDLRQVRCDHGHVHWTLIGSGGQRTIKNVSTDGCLALNERTKSIIQVSCGDSRARMSGSTSWNIPRLEPEPDAVSPGTTIVAQQYSGHCIDVKGASDKIGGGLKEEKCNRELHQQFKFLQYGDSYQIRADHSGLCLGVDSTSRTAKIFQGTCQQDAKYLWKVSGTSDRRKIQNNYSGLCMAVEWTLWTILGSDETIVQDKCDDDDQIFFRIAGLDEQPSDVFVSSTIRQGGQCIDRYWWDVGSGTRITQGDCDGSGSQRFKFAKFGDYYQLRKTSTLCLGRSGSSGDGVVQETCNTSDDEQFWRVTGSGSERKIQNKATSRCIVTSERTIWEYLFGNKINLGDCDSSRASFDIESLEIGVPVWQGPYNSRVVGASAANTVDGKVILWSSFYRTDGGETGRTFTALFDPETASLSEALVDFTGHDMFCPGTTFLADGRLMVSGGDNARKVTMYNPSTNTWEAGPDMVLGRGYQVTVMLPDGKVYTNGGSWEEGEGAPGGKDSEIYDPATDSWSLLPGIPSAPFETNDKLGPYRSDNHYWLFTGSNGLIFHAGPSVNMHWIDVTGDGSYSSAGVRDDDEDAMTGTATMFDVDKILTTGGAVDYDEADASPRAYVIDISDPDNIVVTRQPDMIKPRAMHNAAVLPDGKVLITGGVEYAKIFTDAETVIEAELWDPALGTFTVIPTNMKVPRNYHSTSITLKDGRVMTAGGGNCGFECDVNHPDVEIYTPDYLRNPDGTLATRPVIQSSHYEVAPGDVLEVEMDTADSHSFSLVKFGAVTHSINVEQRRIPLTATQAGSVFQVQLPTSGNILLPGFYYLFAMNSAGVPSVAVSLYNKNVV